MGRAILREKAALCARLADGLSLNNPGRFQLMDLAEDFMKRAKELKRDGQNNKGNPNRKKMDSQAGLVPFYGPCSSEAHCLSCQRADASRRAVAHLDEFALSRCATGHKLDIQRYKGRASPQIATLFERAA